MKNSDLLITFASWEDRFRMGFDANLDTVGTRKALVFYFGSYANRTRKNRHVVSEACNATNIEYIPVELDVDKPADNWRTVLKSIDKSIVECKGILIDISTMPREIIWYVLWMAEQCPVVARYVYHSPRCYGDDWLSRDPRAPRLVYKLSGIALPLAKTALLVTVGFDSPRAECLISRYEPAKLLIGVQTPSHFPRNIEEMAVYSEKIEEYSKNYECRIFKLDAFAEDRGMAAIRKALKPLGTSYNIIMGSLGPKLTAITLYKLQRQRDNIGLVYAPSNKFNENYSTGIGSCFEGTI